MRQGNNYTLLKLEDPRGCDAVNISTWGHPKFSNSDHVRVEGVFKRYIIRTGLYSIIRWKQQRSSFCLNSGVGDCGK